MIKTCCSIFLLIFFSGCIQGTAFLGPAVTVASTGNVYQPGLSYGSSKAIKKITGKTPVENLKLLLEPKKDENKIVTSVKRKIIDNNKITHLLNQ